MRTFLIALTVLLVSTAIYAYQKSPKGCVKLGNDLQTDLTAIFVASTAPAAADGGAATDSSASASTAPDAPAANPAPPPVPPVKPYKLWSPPATIPAQPNWTWTTVDGQTYQDVTISKIEPDTVSIMHSTGVTKIDISTLPADLQKQLNYDPEAAADAKTEEKRQEDHPYYTMDQIPDAEAAAQQTHKPIAWLCSWKASLSTPNPDPSSEDGTTQTVLSYLEPKTIVIFEDGGGELGKLPKPVIDELFHLDDGPMPGGHHYWTPKVVFSSPDATTTFGRVWYTEMKTSGMEPITAMLNLIQSNSDYQAILKGPTSSPAAGTP